MRTRQICSICFDDKYIEAQTFPFRRFRFMLDFIQINFSNPRQKVMAKVQNLNMTYRLREGPQMFKKQNK